MFPDRAAPAIVGSIFRPSHLSISTNQAARPKRPTFSVGWSGNRMDSFRVVAKPNAEN